MRRSMRGRSKKRSHNSSHILHTFSNHFLFQPFIHLLNV
jgi:hypothetical protein